MKHLGRTPAEREVLCEIILKRRLAMADLKFMRSAFESDPAEPLPVNSNTTLRPWIEESSIEINLGDYRSWKNWKSFSQPKLREKVHMVEEHNAHAYRLAQTQEVLDLFQAAHRGRPARTVEELEEWAGSPERKQVASKRFQ